jgi:hypothetical protein
MPELPAKRPRLSTPTDSNGDRRQYQEGFRWAERQQQKTVMTRNQTNPQTDIWGRPPRPPNENVECSVCNRQVSTVRFAPHLDKCMGIGTTSVREEHRRPRLEEITLKNADRSIHLSSRDSIVIVIYPQPS